MAEPRVVPADAAGMRLDRWLAETGLAGSRSAAQQLIGAGRVTLDGGGAKPSTRLAGGERVAVDPFPEAVSPPPPGLDVVFADEWVMVVDKPAGLVVHPAPGYSGPTLAGMLAGEAAGGEPGRAGIVHRLDRDTSGLLVVARSEEAHRRLSGAMRAREIHREYAALVTGTPESRTGTVEAPLGRDPRDPSRVVIGGNRARGAITHFETEEVLPGHTLLAVRLETGRTHQIRVHLAAIGLPVAGDPRYGDAGALGLERQFLHARRLVFAHPGTGEESEFASELPPDLASALSLAREGRS